jgi:hypothetical protein
MRKIFIITLVFVLAVLMFACGGEEYKCEECGEVFDSEEALNEHIAEAHGEAEVTEPAEETAVEPAEGAADVVAMKGDFKTVFDDVNEYMETHNQSNTGADELSAAYGDFAAAFTEMKEKYGTVEPAGPDKTEYEKMLGLMDKAATSMSKYSEGIAKGIPDGIALSLEGATLWDEVKNEFGGAV